MNEDYLDYAVGELVNGDVPPTAIMSLHGTPSSVLENTLAEHDQESSIRYLAWDLSEEVQAGLEAGTVDGAMVQNAYFYGYLAAHISYAMAAAGEGAVMEILEAYFDPGHEDKLLDTGMSFITPETLATFLDYQTTCLGVSSG